MRSEGVSVVARFSAVFANPVLVTIHALFELTLVALLLSSVKRGLKALLDLKLDDGRAEQGDDGAREDVVNLSERSSFLAVHFDRRGRFGVRRGRRRSRGTSIGRRVLVEGRTKLEGVSCFGDASDQFRRLGVSRFGQEPLFNVLDGISRVEEERISGASVFDEHNDLNGKERGIHQILLQKAVKLYLKRHYRHIVSLVDGCQLVGVVRL